MPANSHNPFSSDFLRSDSDHRLRPPGTRSYVAGATDDPLKFMTIPQLLDRACARFGSRPAAICSTKFMSVVPPPEIKTPNRSGRWNGLAAPKEKKRVMPLRPDCHWNLHRGARRMLV